MSAKSESLQSPITHEEIEEEVRRRYGRVASEGTSCCATGCCGSLQPEPLAVALGYDPAELEALPAGANLGLGCGAPVAFLDLSPGETVLDLGSGPGLDAMLAARRVGPEGRVIGVDMTPEMVKRARSAVAEAGLQNVEFRQGRLEALPLDDASVDAVTSNCVINLVPDKAVVFREIARVLKPGGRAVISDVVLDGPLPHRLRGDILAYVGCVAGAARREEYFQLLRAAGFDRLEILKETDFLALTGGAIPTELRDELSSSGLTLDDLSGRVLSITYRATRRAAPAGPGSPGCHD